MAVIKFLTSNFFIGVLIQIGYYVILSSSLNLILGYGGMFNLGQGAFFAVGAYASALVVTRLGLPLLAEIIIAGLCAAVFGLIIGFPSIRLKGDYLSFLTFGFAVVVHTILKQWVSVTNGDAGLAGIPRLTFFKYFGADGIALKKPWMILLFTVFLVVVLLFIMYRILHSPYGRTIESIRENETASAACGRDVSRIRVSLFCTGAAFAGVAGVLYGHYLGVVDPTGFTTTVSFNLVSMVLIGGMGSYLGAIAGAVIVTFVPEILRLFNSIQGVNLPIEHLKNVIFSLMLIVIIMKRPRGLFGKLKF